MRWHAAQTHLEWLHVRACRPDLEFIRAQVDKSAIERLEAVAGTPFERITYTRAIEILQDVVASKKKKFEFKVRARRARMGLLCGEVRPVDWPAVPSLCGPVLNPHTQCCLFVRMIVKAVLCWPTVRVLRRPALTRRSARIDGQCAPNERQGGGCVTWVHVRACVPQVEWGIDLASEHERYLTEEVFRKPVIVHDYPAGIKAFYMRLNDDGRTVAAMDVLVPKVGELIGGSQREDRLEVGLLFLYTPRRERLTLPLQPGRSFSGGLCAF